MTSKLFKYLLLAVTGFAVIIWCSSFQHILVSTTPDYYFSTFLRVNYSLAVKIIFFIIGLAAGYYFHLNPWLVGLCLVSVFPLTSVIEATIYEGSHNLIPFEFTIHFMYALPSIIAGFIGRFIYRQLRRRKEKINEIAQNKIH
jgi:hypothetical protein